MGDGNHVQQLLNSLLNDVDEDLDECDPLKSIASRANLRPSHLFLAAFLFTTVMCLISNPLAHFFVTLFCMLYPACMSLTACHRGHTQLMPPWLTYWLILGLCTVLDRLLLLIFFFLPIYYFFKLLFLVWLFYPKTDGTSIVYRSFVKPHLSKLIQKSKKHQA